MSFDRNELEQQALKYISREQYDKAIECYASILRRDTKDVRARQKIAELYLRSGKRTEAFRQFRDVARMHTAAGNHRAALALYKQLIKMKPDDAELETNLADSYFLSGFRTEAIPHYESAFEAYFVPEPAKALEVGRQLLKLRSDDVALRMRMAEMVRNTNPAASYELYRGAIDEYRRRGQMSEVARVARLALAIKPGEPDLLVDAAEACLAADDREQALEHLRAAYAADNQNLRVLEMLAKALEGAGQGAKASVVWQQLARVQEQKGDLRGRLASLERAVAAAGSDPAAADADLVITLRQARETLEKTELRLTQLPVADPSTQEELRVCTRAEVFGRYGLYARAQEELRKALVTAPSSPALLAWAAETAARLGDTEAAIAQANALAALVGGADRAKVELRVALLSGVSPSELGGSPPVQVEDDELIDDEELVEDEPTPTPVEDEELVEDEATEPPVERQEVRAPPPPSRGLADAFGDDDEPGDDLFADVFRAPAASTPAPPPVAAPRTTPPPAAPPPAAPPRAAAPPPARPPAPRGADSLEEARGMVGLGMHQDALQIIGDTPGLEAAVLRARCLRELGDLEAAIKALRGALLDAADEDPGLAPALFELADLSGRAGRRRVALRCLLELEEFHPSHRADEVSARVKALRRVLGR